MERRIAENDYFRPFRQMKISSRSVQRNFENVARYRCKHLISSNIEPSFNWFSRKLASWRNPDRLFEMKFLSSRRKNHGQQLDRSSRIFPQGLRWPLLCVARLLLLSSCYPGCLLRWIAGRRDVTKGCVSSWAALDEGYFGQDRNSYLWNWACEELRTSVFQLAVWVLTLVATDQ